MDTHFVVRYAHNTPGSFFTHFPLAFSTLGQIIHESAIANLCLAITLRIIWSGKLVLDFLLGIEVGYLVAGEVSPIIRYNGMANTEASDNMNPRELDNMLSSDL